MRRPPSLCFVSPQALPALTGGQSGLGGAEMQQVLVGRELARRGHEITFIVGAKAGSIPREVDGLRLISCRLGAGRGVEGRRRTGMRKGWKLIRETGVVWRAMSQAAADVYSVRSNHFAAAIAAAWCRTWSVPFLFAVGHDGNCDPELAHRRLSRASRASYAAALRSAAAVVTQTGRQRTMMQAGFGLEGEVIPNAAAVDRRIGGFARTGVVWVGSIEPRKGPDRLLEIARRLPGVGFTMIGGRGDHPGFHDEIMREARRTPNVVWRGPLSHERTIAQIARAAVYLNTSRSEGFPNTFLEAWLLGTPVVSLEIDPDGPGDLQRRGIGLVAGAGPAACREIASLLCDGDRREAMARASRHHVESRHTLSLVASRWEALLERIAGRDGPAGAA